jgi:hypothetical protein
VDPLSGEGVANAVVTAVPAASREAWEQGRSALVLTMTRTRGGMAVPIDELDPDGTRTDDEGNFRLPGLRPGSRLLVHIRHQQYLTHTVEDFTVAAEGTNRLGTIALDRGAHIRGRVHVQDQESAASETVMVREVTPDGSTGANGTRTGHTTAHGEYSVTGLTGGAFQVEVLGHTATQRTVELEAHGDLEVDLYLGAGRDG